VFLGKENNGLHFFNKMIHQYLEDIKITRTTVEHILRENEIRGETKTILDPKKVSLRNTYFSDKESCFLKSQPFSVCRVIAALSEGFPRRHCYSSAFVNSQTKESRGQGESRGNFRVSKAAKIIVSFRVRSWPK